MFVIKKLKRKLIVISLIFFILLLITFNDLIYSDVTSIKDRIERSVFSYVEQTKLPPNMKYILKYSDTAESPFLYIPDGHEIFLQRNCSVSNCYFTSNSNFLKNITDFHALLIFGPYAVRRNPFHYLPKERTSTQSYIFTNTESADNHFVPDERYNQVFNFTWSYKLNSDIYYGYMVVRNQTGQVIGPKVNMTWINVDDMMPIQESVKEKLIHKKYAAAWFVSNCNTHGRRERKGLLIYEELIKYNMSVDIFGGCAYRQCPRRDMAFCLKMLQRDYYFYFAFENSLSDDYVTEKLLYPLQNFAVPVVFGGADYKRFMPDGIYLNAREMTAKHLAKLMFEIIQDKNRYYNFFKWHNHYTYQYPEGISDIDSFCEFCSFINQVNPNGNIVVDDFYEWWNPHVRPVNLTALESKNINTSLRSYLRRSG